MIMEAVNRGEVMRVVEKPFESAGLVGAVEDAMTARPAHDGGLPSPRASRV